MGVVLPRPQRGRSRRLKPYYLFSTGINRGTTHGTPYPYDTHVPLMVYGTGIRPGTRNEAVTPQAAAAILAHGLGIAAPAKCERRCRVDSLNANDGSTAS